MRSSVHPAHHLRALPGHDSVIILRPRRTRRWWWGTGGLAAGATLLAGGLATLLIRLSSDGLPPSAWFVIIPLLSVGGAAAGVFLTEWLRGREVILDSAQRHVRMIGYRGRGRTIVPYGRILSLEEIGGRHDLVALHLAVSDDSVLRLVFPDPAGRARLLVKLDSRVRTDVAAG